jgi:hypothetical protein
VEGQTEPCWRPTYASGVNQGEILLSNVQRDVLTPTDFPRTIAWERELAVSFVNAMRTKPINWACTKIQVLTKFSSSPPRQLAA